MLCSSCMRRETTGNYKTCERCRLNKRSYYHRKRDQEKQEREQREQQEQQEREREQREVKFDEKEYIEKMDHYHNALRILVARINDDIYEKKHCDHTKKKHVESIKKIFNFF